MLPNEQEMIAAMEASEDENARKMGREMRERAEKKERYLAEIRAASDWNKLLVMADSQSRAETLASLPQDLTPDEVRGYLKEWWPLVDGSRGFTQEILGMFLKAEFTTDQEDFEIGSLVTDGDGDIEIFRGNVGEDPGLGFSWTLDRKVAERFASAPFGIRHQILGIGAHREDGEEPIASVWGGWARPEQVLGYFNGRGEKEIIVARSAYQPVLVAQAVSQAASDG